MTAAPRELGPGAVALVLLLSALWGGNVVAVKIGLVDSPPLMLAALRFAIGGVCVVLWGWRTRAPFRLRPGEGPPLLALGLLFAIQLGLLNVGVWLSTAGHASVLLNAYPVYIVLLAHFLVPGDQLSVAKLGGVLLGFGGILLLFSAPRSLTADGSTLPGDLVLSASALLLALRQVVLNRQLQYIHPLKPLLSQVVIGIPLFLALSAVLERQPTVFTWRLAGSLFYQGVLIAGFNFIANMFLLKTYRPSALAAFSLTTPLFGVVATALVLGEPVTWRLALSALLVAGGIAVATIVRARVRLGRVAVGLLVGALASGPAFGAAQPVVSSDVRSEATRVFGELARIRGLPSPGPAPPIVVRTREERRRFVLQEIQRKYTSARVDAERRALVAWGLAPPAFDLAAFLADLLAEQAAAYYDPVAKTMVLANWLTPELRADALAHELVHALQDRQISLDRFLTGIPGRGDEALARQALIEGEAVALQLELRLRGEGRDLTTFPDLAALQRAIVASATGPVLTRAPRFLKASLTFPYAQGVGFVAEFRRRRPWARLSDLYVDPPRATAQILHPERYFDRREDPVRLSLPALGDILGADAHLVIEDELGEFGLTQVLRQFLGEDTGADGWAGDRYALWTAPPGVTVLVALTVWRDEAAAGAFADGYVRLLGAKHRAGAPAAGGLSAWPANGLAAERRGRHVLLVEGAPPGTLDALRDALWRGRVTGAYRAPARLSSTMPASITAAPGQISRTR